MGRIKLCQLSRSLEAVGDKTKFVMFDFGGYVPGEIASYRGYYSHLAIDWLDRGQECTVNKLLTAAKRAVGDAYFGYKGGEYVMDADTPIWAAHWGDCTSTAII